MARKVLPFFFLSETEKRLILNMVGMRVRQCAE
nr:MAG TPA: Ribonucleotide reductase inhibitor [Caudoviricetes sp.]